MAALIKVATFSEINPKKFFVCLTYEISPSWISDTWFHEDSQDWAAIAIVLKKEHGKSAKKNQQTV